MRANGMDIMSFDVPPSPKHEDDDVDEASKGNADLRPVRRRRPSRLDLEARVRTLELQVARLTKLAAQVTRLSPADLAQAGDDHHGDSDLLEASDGDDKVHDFADAFLASACALDAGTPTVISAPRLRIEVDGLVDEWLIDKRLPAMSVHLVREDTNQRFADVPSCTFKFDLQDSTGRLINEFLDDKEKALRVMSKGEAYVGCDQLRIRKVSSKCSSSQGSFFNLVCSVLDPRLAPLVKPHAHKIVIKRQEGKTHQQLKASDPVIRLHNIGRDTAERLRGHDVFTIADLASLPQQSESPLRFQKLLRGLRKQRGRLTERVFDECIQNARLVVGGDAAEESDASEPSASLPAVSPVLPVPDPALPASDIAALAAAAAACGAGLAEESSLSELPAPNGDLHFQPFENMDSMGFGEVVSGGGGGVAN